MKGWRSRLVAFTFGFKVSLIAVFLYSLIVGLFLPKQHSTNAHAPAPAATQHQCSAETYFISPESIFAALKSEDVTVRRDMFRRLFLRPNVATIYYDYERDREYPERAAEADMRYVNLDDDAAPEALITFARFEQPVALILKRDECGWRLCAALSAWLRFEDYPYQNWLELPELVKPGTHELLLHESTGDASAYVRKVRVLKLLDGALVQVAEFNEEEITPVADYRGTDWNDVKQRTTTNYSLVPAMNGNAPRLQLTTLSELSKYDSTVPLYTYWRETDGTWHVQSEHWRKRPVVRLKQLAAHTENLIWDEQRQRFVAAQE
ncbi:MAG: hypothetical protein DMF64_06265 [Acidobacteria bacterium]|nr:MAG: hypothetical protein DMF64_06265 [Acidobacteriota bacterium]